VKLLLGSKTLREEHRLKIFENMVLWKIFGQDIEQEIGDWGKQCHVKLHKFYDSPVLLR
jgi:hypothetical protein